jgi:GxxExxY protein
MEKDNPNLIQKLFDSDNTKEPVNQITEKIIGCAYKVSNHLGTGFLEKVYENALRIEIQKTGLKVEQQKPIRVLYEGVIVGEFFADLLIENSVLIELKAVRSLDDVHMAQCLNYLRATNLKICLLINFGKPKVELKRIII